MSALGRLEEADFQERLLVDWAGLGTNSNSAVFPYLVGEVSVSVDLDAYLIVVGTDYRLYLYRGNDFVVVSGFDHAAVAPNPIDRVDLGEIVIDNPLTLIDGVTVTFSYELPEPGTSYYFRIISQWDWLQEAVN